MGRILGIDIGTTNVKAALFAHDGTCIDSLSIPYPTHRPRYGWAEQNPCDWYAASAGSVKKLLEANGKEDIDAVGISGQVRNISFIKKDGSVAYPGIVWSDTRADDTINALSPAVKKKVAAIGGNDLSTTFSLAQVLWIKEHRPEIFNDIRYLMAPKDYVLYRLTETFLTDPSSQGGSLFLDIKKRDFSQDILDLFGIAREMLPEVLEPTCLAGSITPQASEETGLAVGTPVIVGGGDNDCTSVGAGVYEVGDISISLGTAGIVLTPIDAPISLSAGALDVFPHVFGKWYTMGMIKSAGAAIAEVKARLSDEAMAAAGLSPMPTGQWIDGLAATAKYEPGSAGLFCFPYFNGRGSPKKDNSVRAAFWNVSATHQNFHMVQACMEGVAYCARRCIDIMKSVQEVKRVVCCGTGSVNELWMNIFADVLNIPTYTGNVTQDGTLGAAMLSAAGVGIYSDAPSALKAMTFMKKQYAPKPEIAARYDELYHEYITVESTLWG